MSGSKAIFITLAGVLCSMGAQALPSQVIECSVLNMLGDIPLNVEPRARITRHYAQVEAINVVEAENWGVADFEGGASELEVFFFDGPSQVEPGRDPFLHIVDGRNSFDDKFEDRSAGSGVIEIEDHVIVSFGFNLADSEGLMFDDHLRLPEVLDLAQVEQAVCFVEWRLQSRSLFFPNGIMRGLPALQAIDPGPDDGQDDDGDGISNRQDICPQAYNPGQHDADRDLQGDACDPAYSRILEIIDVPGGDEQAFLDAIAAANARSLHAQTEIRLAGNLQLPAPGNGAAERVRVERPIRIVSARPGGQLARIAASGQADGARFATVTATGALVLDSVELGGMSAAQGAAVLVKDGGELKVRNSVFSGNSATGDGGAIHFSGAGRLDISQTRFLANVATRGGAVFIDAPDARPGQIQIGSSEFSANTASGQGCDLFAAFPEADATRVVLDNILVNQTCSRSLVLDSGAARLQASTLSSGSELLRTGGEITLAGTVLARDSGSGLHSADLPGPAGLHTACSVQGVGAITSSGFNLASDDSCALDHPTDLAGVDPGLSPPDANGVRSPTAGSPVIDAGLDELVMPDQANWPGLPCGWRDAAGLGRPQDGNGDGIFECDIGAVEAPGPGAIVAGHSGAYFNPARNGEGQYVEVLEGKRAVIYTFTYAPEGGPAWFQSIADVRGNSLVSNAMIRPVGARFGDDFDAADVWFTDWGGMSMVFPDCAASAQPGNVVYSGSQALAYEPLITRARRLTHIGGCGAGVAPSAMAGLSGSFFDPGRNGEGIVVEWLPNGDVLMIVFTYDLQGRQFWMFGQGTPDGASVTMEAFYPSGDARWGGEFDPGAVGLARWGVMSLEYSDCDSLTFSYDADEFRWGDASREYTRLSRLAGLDCPDF